MKSLIMLLIVFVVTGANAATKYVFEPKAGKVEFKTKGWPNLITIKGEGTGVTGHLEEKTPGTITGTLEFDLTTLKTGIDLRDSHMKDNYLEVKKHPKAQLIIDSLKAPTDLSGDFEFTGKLKLHGVEKDVTGKAELAKSGEMLSLKADIPIKLTDFQIAIPSYQGITVAEKVNIAFESKVKTL